LEYDPETRKVEIPQMQVEQLIRAKYLSANDFNEGREKIKLTDGTKLTSRSFKLKTLTIEGVTFEKVRCKMVDNGEPSKLGTSIFDDYFGIEVKEGKIWLKKIDDGN